MELTHAVIMTVLAIMKFVIGVTPGWITIVAGISILILLIPTHIMPHRKIKGGHGALAGIDNTQVADS
jgi:hypothetical protein